MPWLDALSVTRDQQGRISAPAQATYPFETSVSGIFAGGDVVRGSDLVVTAIAEGRRRQKVFSIICTYEQSNYLIMLP